MFPLKRMRRLRQSDNLRELVAETSLSANDLIHPIFIGLSTEEIKSMPGIFRLSIKDAMNEIEQALKFGIKSCALFPVVSSNKDSTGSEALCENNLICQAIRQIKTLGISIIADVALDPYTDHGHDGVLINGEIDNDKSISILEQYALNLTSSGADVVAPSDMMDGRIGQIRKFLDSHGFYNTCILSYTAKYASSFYGPFRDAIGSKKNLASHSKKTYQMDIRNRKEALEEARLDFEENADFLLIKPGIFYLDILSDISKSFNIPVFAYQVSGEYSMLKFGAQNNLFNFEDAIMETMICFKRAGASSIISYAAIEVAKCLSQ